MDENQGQLNILEDNRRSSANLNKVRLQVWIEDIKDSLISKFQPIASADRISRSKVTYWPIDDRFVDVTLLGIFGLLLSMLLLADIYCFMYGCG